ncbi:hypothetical protein D3C75_1355850 [compost metagenome]
MAVPARSALALIVTGTPIKPPVSKSLMPSSAAFILALVSSLPASSVRLATSENSIAARKPCM